VSRASRDKGARIEREIVARHVAIGIKAERVPLSGSVRYRGNGCDIDVYAFGTDARAADRRGEGARQRARLRDAGTVAWRR
jgi:hypothetical protein